MSDSETNARKNGESTELCEEVKGQCEVPKKRFSFMIEVALCITLLSISLTAAATSNLVMYRVCVHPLNYPRTKCEVFINGGNKTQELEQEVQKQLTVVNTVKYTLEPIIPCALALFLGAWSDRHGRKPLLTWPLFGIATSGVLTAIFAMVDSMGPWWYVISNLPFTITGGTMILFTGAYCYVSDVTTVESRTMRMFMVQAAVSSGGFIGSITSAWVLKLTGTTYLLVIGAVLHLTAYFSTCMFLREPLANIQKIKFCSMIDSELVKEMFRNCVKRRPNRVRGQLFVLLATNGYIVLIVYGFTKDLEYMYTREKLQWTLPEFNMFAATTTLLMFCGGFVGIVLFQKILKFDDLCFANVTFLTTIVESVIKGLAVVSWHLYLGAAFSIFRGLLLTVIRSYISKILPASDVTKFLTLMAGVNGVFMLIAPVIYNSLYRNTIEVFPGAIYGLNIFNAVGCVVLIVIVQFMRRNTNGSNKDAIDPTV